MERRNRQSQHGTGDENGAQQMILQIIDTPPVSSPAAPKVVGTSDDSFSILESRVSCLVAAPAETTKTDNTVEEIVPPGEHKSRVE